MILQDDERRVVMENRIANTATIKRSMIIQWLHFSPNDCCVFKADHWKKDDEALAAEAVLLGMPEFGSAL